MKLTGEQLAAVVCDENAVLEACPGSGKTRAIVAKALRCLDDIRNSARKIAIITYTNAAVYEIEARLRIYGATGDLDQCEVSTIHSFCLSNVLNRFSWRLEDYKNGFSVLPSDSEQYQEIVAGICQRHRLRNAEEQFPLLSRDVRGEPILGQSSPITASAARDFWRELSATQNVDFSTIVYLTYCLLRDYSSLAHALSCRFKWILVDELQDTTELQIEILKLLFEAGKSLFFLVGDPYQSIYGFAGARPALIAPFTEYIQAADDFQLSQNWRSNPQIIADAELLLPRLVPMNSAGPIATDGCRTEYVHVGEPFVGLEDYFLPALDSLGIPYGDSAVLAPSWFALLPIGRRLRNYGVPVVGPGSRPYRAAHSFARLSEYVCEYLTRPQPKLIKNLERELFRVVFEVSRVNRFDIFTYSGRVVIFRLLEAGRNVSEESPAAARWLNEAAAAFDRILVEEELFPKEAMNFLGYSARLMCEQMEQNQQVDLNNLTISDLGLFASTDRNLKLLTMHGSKGLEFGAVALIGLNDGTIPNYRATTSDDIAEYRRLFYVAITRAKRYLLYISDQSRERNTPSRFLREIGKC